MRRIYLDHNATTPIDPRVLEAMTAVLRDDFGNRSSLDVARAQVAALVGASANEIVFTGSGTESDNMALRGVAGMSRDVRRKILYSSIEHHAVVNTAKALAEDGVPTEALRVTGD